MLGWGTAPPHRAPTDTAEACAETCAVAELAADPDFVRFQDEATRGNLVPLYARLFSDQLTPVTAYRCLVRADDREAPSFLFESVVNGTQQVLSWCPRLGRPGCATRTSDAELLCTRLSSS